MQKLHHIRAIYIALGVWVFTFIPLFFLFRMHEVGILAVFTALLMPITYFASFRQRNRVVGTFLAVYLLIYVFVLTPAHYPYKTHDSYEVLAINETNPLFPQARVVTEPIKWTKRKNWTVLVEPGAYFLYGDAQTWIEHEMQSCPDCALINFDVGNLFMRGHAVLALNNQFEHHPSVLSTFNYLCHFRKCKHIPVASSYITHK
jgi:hypothetical protein